MLLVLLVLMVLLAVAGGTTHSKTTAEGEDIPWRCGHRTGAGAAVSLETEKG